MLLMLFTLPESEEEMNIQCLQMEPVSGQYKLKDADYSHNMQSNYETSCCRVL